MGDTRKGRLVIYPETADKTQWRWQLATSNGSVMLDSAQVYTSKRNALLAAIRLLAMVQKVQFVPVDHTGVQITV
jgi:uncharacterized protein YegP (UPF0339 family)